MGIGDHRHCPRTRTHIAHRPRREPSPQNLDRVIGNGTAGEPDTALRGLQRPARGRGEQTRIAGVVVVQQLVDNHHTGNGQAPLPLMGDGENGNRSAGVTAICVRTIAERRVRLRDFRGQFRGRPCAQLLLEDLAAHASSDADSIIGTVSEMAGGHPGFAVRHRRQVAVRVPLNGCPWARGGAARRCR